MLETTQATEKKPYELVFTTSCRAKENHESPIKNFVPGDEATVIGHFAHELVAMKRAVHKGSPEHKAWAEEQKKAPSKKDEVADLKKQLAESNAALAAAQKQIDKLSK